MASIGNSGMASHSEGIATTSTALSVAGQLGHVGQEAEIRTQAGPLKRCPLLAHEAICPEGHDMYGTMQLIALAIPQQLHRLNEIAEAFLASMKRPK